MLHKDSKCRAPTMLAHKIHLLHVSDIALHAYIAMHHAIALTQSLLQLVHKSTPPTHFFRASQSVHRSPLQLDSLVHKTAPLLFYLPACLPAAALQFLRTHPARPRFLRSWPCPPLLPESPPAAWLHGTLPI